MKNSIALRSRLLCTALTLAALAAPALAGPPLICHMFIIGDAKSLPWGAGEKGWYAPKGDYDTKRLADDTIALLTDSTPVIVRMETIRRAALYSGKDAALSQALLNRFKTRATGNNQGKLNAFYLFDYGYLIETMKQGSMVKELQNSSAAVNGLNGLTLIQEALQLRGTDSEMEFAAALVTEWPKNDQHQRHFRKAVLGAAGDPLLAKNLLEHFPNRGKSLAELRAGVDTLARQD